MYMENRKRERRNGLQHKKKNKRKTNKDNGYKNSSQRFRPLGPSVLVVQFSDSLALFKDCVKPQGQI